MDAYSPMSEKAAQWSPAFEVLAAAEKEGRTADAYKLRRALSILFDGLSWIPLYEEYMFS